MTPATLTVLSMYVTTWVSFDLRCTEHVRHYLLGHFICFPCKFLWDTIQFRFNTPNENDLSIKMPLSVSYFSYFIWRQRGQHIKRILSVLSLFLVFIIFIKLLYLDGKRGRPRLVLTLPLTWSYWQNTWTSGEFRIIIWMYCSKIVFLA